MKNSQQGRDSVTLSVTALQWGCSEYGHNSKQHNYNFSNKGNLLKKRLNNNMKYTSVQDLPYAAT